MDARLIQEARSTVLALSYRIEDAELKAMATNAYKQLTDALEASNIEDAQQQVRRHILKSGD